MKTAIFVAFVSLIVLAAVVLAFDASWAGNVKAQVISAPNVTIHVMYTHGGGVCPTGGTYTYIKGINGSAILTATAAPGWQFAFWEVYGFMPGSTPAPLGETGLAQITRLTQNPIDATDNTDMWGYEFQYEAVFIQSTSGTSSIVNGVPILYVAGIVVGSVAAVALVGVAAYTTGKRKAK